MSETNPIKHALYGLGRWTAVFAAGFMIGYALMSVMIEDPVAGELPPETPAYDAAPIAAPVPTELPPIALDDLERNAPMHVKPTDSPAAVAHTQLEPEIIDSAEVVDELPKPWWEACHRRRCRLDFGSISGNLTMRKASLTHGSTIDWERDLSGKPRVDSLPTERSLDVRVDAIAMSAEGRPAAAEIVWSRRGRAVRGVITLDLGEPGKRIVMHP